MGKFKGTPGPWYVIDEHYPGIETTPDLKGDYGKTIVTFGFENDTDFQGVQGDSKEIRKFNAQLIAAAPDLLEALQIVLGDIESVPPQTKQKKIAIARKAIDKALLSDE